MSVFSNPATNAQATAAQYVADLLKTLGDRDPFLSQERTPDAIAEAIRGLSPVTLRKPEKEGKWSIAQVIQHLADSELVLGFRYRMIIAHDQPPITGYDQDLWAEKLGYSNADPQKSLEQLRVLRTANLRLLRSLPLETFKRVGLHSERGPESLDLIIRLAGGHDLVHLRQIERIKQAVSD